MLSSIRESLRTEILAVRQRSQTAEKLRAFEELTDDQAFRASYFVEMAGMIERLGLANPHEATALSIEPTHPVSPKGLAGVIADLGLDPLLQTAWSDAKLSLISLPMLENYTGSAEIRRMRQSGFTEPYYLLDPLYGFVFVKDRGVLRNHCLAIDIWSSHLNSMPKSLAAQLWKNRADVMLSGGALAGRLLFSDFLSDESDPIKRVAVPELQANSEVELVDLVRGLTLSATSASNVQLWFRGQSTDYSTPDRQQLAKRGIAPYSNVSESDLTPSLYRKYDSWLEDTAHYEELVIELAEWVTAANQIVPRDSRSLPFNGVATPSKAGVSAYQRGLLLQQYGAPSAYLDISSDALVAAWFATHRCSLDAEGRMVYRRHVWSGTAVEGWPTIFVFPLVRGLHPFLDLESILAGSGALRPERQKCGLLGGAGNLARNYCARYVGLKIRLGPRFALSRRIPPTELFPPPSEDKVLHLLKEAGLGRPERDLRLAEVATGAGLGSAA